MLVVMDRRGHGVWVDAMTRLGEHSMEYEYGGRVD